MTLSPPAPALGTLPHWETHARRPPGGHPRDQGRAPRPHRGLRPHGRRGLRRGRGSASPSAVAEIQAPSASAARRCGRSSSTPTSRPAPSPPEQLDAAARGAAASSSAATSTASRPSAGTPTSSTTSRRNEFFENYRGPGDDFFGSVGSKPEIYPIYWSPAQMEARQSDRMANVQAFLNSPVEARVGRRHVVRPRPRLALPRPHPPPPAGRRLRRPRHPPRPRHPRPVDDRGLPAGLPAPLRRQRRAVRPLGRRLPHLRPAVPRHHHVLGLPHLPGLDRAVRHGPRPGRPAHRPDPRGDGLPDAAPAARRRRRGRHVRRHRQPGLPGEREVAPAAHARRCPASPTSRPATPSGGTAT